MEAGSNYYGQCNTQDWRDIMAVSAGRDHTVGLKADGTVVAVGNNGRNQCDIQKWRDILVDKEYLRRKLRKSQGLSQDCGGNLSFFGKKCKSCGKVN